MRIDFKKNKIGCCGLHDVCEKNLPRETTIREEVEYYDDEELDVFCSYTPDAYSEEEIAQFREILDTMLESDIPGWLHSLQIRGIPFPHVLENEISFFIH
jgi:hypothetical protein